MSSSDTRKLIEQIAREVGLRATGTCPDMLDWTKFDELAAIARSFDVPHSTYTAHMCALTWALARVKNPKTIVGLGTFTGWPFAWLAGLASHHDSPVQLAAIDIDADVFNQAKSNLSKLGFGQQLQVLTADARKIDLQFPPIDLLFIDVDDPVRGKEDYALLLRRWRRQLADGALVLGHDVCVPRFKNDFKKWRVAAKELNLGGPVDLPIDECGLSVVLS